MRMTEKINRVSKYRKILKKMSKFWRKSRKARKTIIVINGEVTSKKPAIDNSVDKSQDLVKNRKKSKRLTISV